MLHLAIEGFVSEETAAQAVEILGKYPHLNLDLRRAYLAGHGPNIIAHYLSQHATCLVLYGSGFDVEDMKQRIDHQLNPVVSDDSMLFEGD